jgi:hypothetical protein
MTMPPRRNRPVRVQPKGSKRAGAEGAVYRRIVRGVISRDLGICHICGHPGSNAADHVLPVAERPDLAVTPANLKAVHSASKNGGGQCPACSVAATVKAGKEVRIFCNEIRGALSIERARRVIAGRTGLPLATGSSATPHSNGERDWLQQVPELGTDR